MSTEKSPLTKDNIKIFGLNENFDKKKNKKFDVPKLAKEPSPSEIDLSMKEFFDVGGFSCSCD